MIEVIIRDAGPIVASLVSPVVSEWAKKVWFKRGRPGAKKTVTILGPDGKPLDRISSDDK